MGTQSQVGETPSTSCRSLPRLTPSHYRAAVSKSDVIFITVTASTGEPTTWEPSSRDPAVVMARRQVGTDSNYPTSFVIWSAVKYL
ncbi:hypothetical protein J6590_003305 [Homalodisca vitripennis]|nr:hypothetical protein J6590_003305 [Homalodisca vitripennis]